ncbi:hypothetical protein NKDENANG_01838 [Candidatus Entotheonellaceae bacterium PAL068K]
MNDPIATPPCGLNCDAACEIREKMTDLQQSLVPTPTDDAFVVVQTFFRAYRRVCQSAPESIERYPPDIALPALFDLLVSSKYTQRMVSNGGWTYCAGAESDVAPALYSSPLVVYPLEIQLNRPMTEVRDGVSVPKRDHSPATADIDTASTSFYVPHIDLRIPLGERDSSRWPYPALIDFVSEPQQIQLLISAWKELYDVYAAVRQGRSGRRDVDNRKWLTCGCGGKVDDSKNAPGIDRTDDIKKGTYQVLKFGTYYKEKCPRRLLRAALVSNFFPLRDFDRYLSELKDVIWTKEKYSADLDQAAVPSDVAAFDARGIFNLYDALLCLTRSIYRDDHLREIVSQENFIAKFCSPTPSESTI